MNDFTMSQFRNQADLYAAMQDRIRQLEEALLPFAEVCEHDIGLSEASEELFKPMSSQYARAPILKVGHFRDARHALGESK